MKIRINAGGREVEIEGDDADLPDLAMDIWEQTESPKPPPGPALGFQATLASEPRSRHLDTQPLKVVSECMQP